MSLQRISSLLFTTVSLVLAFGATTAHAKSDLTEIYCTIREPAGRLSCFWVEDENKRSMTSSDISTFIDRAQIAAYITIKSRMGLERVYMVDPDSVDMRKLNDVKKTASISDINKAKSDLFNLIELKVVKLSDDLDSAAKTAELIKYDPSIGIDKAKLQQRALVQEVENYHHNDTIYQKAVKANGGMTPAAGEVSLPDARQRVRLQLETNNTNGQFSAGGTSSYRSVDNLGVVANYTNYGDRWVTAGQIEEYTAYSNFNKGATGGSPAFLGSDSQKMIYDVWARENYCYQLGNDPKSKFCPGAELGYDMFPVMSFKSIGFTGVNPNATSVLELQTITDLTAGVNVEFKTDIYRSLSFDGRLGYLYGTGLLGASGNNKPTKNNAYYLDANFDWLVWTGFSVGISVEYMNRNTTFDNTAGAVRTVSVDNNNVSTLDTRFGVAWSWGN